MPSLRPLVTAAVLLLISGHCDAQKASPKTEQTPNSKKHSAKVQTQLNNALFDATKAGNVARMKEVLNKGANVNARDGRDFNIWGGIPEDRGNTPLYMAIEANSIEAARLLISRGANTNAATATAQLQGFDDLNMSFDYPSPLDYAAALNRPKFIKLLLDAGGRATLNEETNPGLAFVLAARLNCLDAMRVMMDLFEDDVKGRVETASGVIWWAAVSHHEEMVKLLIERGADRASCGKSLAEAARFKHLDMAFALLDHADVNAVDIRGDTALFNHIEQSWPEITNMRQLTYGFDPAKLTPEQRTELQAIIDKSVADRQRAADFITALIAKGAKPNAVGREGYSPLLFVIEQGNVPFAKALLEAGANPNYAPAPFPSPLRLLASSGNLGRLNETIDNNTNGGITLEVRAKAQKEAEAKDIDLAELLLEKGAKIQNGDNRYALGEAVHSGNLTLTRLLLEHGADTNLPFQPRPFLLSPMRHQNMSPDEALEQEKEIQKQLGPQPKITLQTPLMWAAFNGHPEIVDALLEAGAKANSRDSRGRNALHYLAGNGRADTIRLWEQRVATIDDRNMRDSSLMSVDLAEPLPSSQMKALSKWSDAGDGQICRSLLAKGCKATDVDKSGRTPLYYAITHSALPVIEALLKATPQKPTHQTMNDLIQLGRRQERSLPALHKLQLDLTEFDRTAMWYSPGGRDFQEANSRARAGRNKSIAQRARLLRIWGEVDAAIISKLLAKGANPNLANNAGLTPLMLAARNGEIEVVRVLLNAGAKVNAKNRSGETVLRQVEKYGTKNLKPLPMQEKPESSEARWLQPTSIKAREQFIRHILATEDAAISKLLRQHGAR